MNAKHPQKGLSAKSTTQSVRIAYTSLVSRALRHAAPASAPAPATAPAHAAALRPTLLAAVEKAVQQPLQV